MNMPSVALVHCGGAGASCCLIPVPQRATAWPRDRRHHELVAVAPSRVSAGMRALEGRPSGTASAGRRRRPLPARASTSPRRGNGSATGEGSAVPNAGRLFSAGSRCALGGLLRRVVHSDVGTNGACVLGCATLCGCWGMACPGCAWPGVSDAYSGYYPEPNQSLSTIIDNPPHVATVFVEETVNE